LLYRNDFLHFQNNIAMKIIDISPEHEHKFFCCLEEWSEEMKEAGDHKQRWYKYMEDKGLRVKLAQDDQEVIAGMIQYVPIEYSMFEGEGLYVMLCIWVHGYKDGIGNYQKRGMGTALLKAAEEDCRQLGADGLVTWGMALPVFMQASWFKKQGYRVIGKEGIMRLLWKPFVENARPPEFMKRRKQPGRGKDKINISVFKTGWCPAMNIVYERTLRASGDFNDKVDVNLYDTTDRRIVEEWGITDGLFIGGKEVGTGPPPSYKKIRKKIKRRIQPVWKFF
jgi:N-acetylglutamate synthase-like GNAT family acetyltransferase